VRRKALAAALALNAAVLPATLGGLLPGVFAHEEA